VPPCWAQWGEAVAAAVLRRHGPCWRASASASAWRFFDLLALFGPPPPCRVSSCSSFSRSPRISLVPDRPKRIPTGSPGSFPGVGFNFQTAGPVAVARRTQRKQERPVMPYPRPKQRPAQQGPSARAISRPPWGLSLRWPVAAGRPPGRAWEHGGKLLWFPSLKPRAKLRLVVVVRCVSRR